MDQAAGGEPVATVDPDDPYVARIKKELEDYP